MEYSIRGKVINSRKQGVPNLVLVFYDVDRFVNLNKSTDLLKDLENKGSERIGSAFTNSLGEFMFEYDHSDFAPDNEEQRPDLIVLVLEAESSDKPKVDDRLLHISNLSIKNASKNEALVILINQGTVSSERPSIPKPQILMNYIQKEEESSNKIKEAIKPNIKKSFLLKEKRQEDDIFSKFKISGLSKSIVNSDLFITKPEDLPRVQELAISKSFEKMSVLNMNSKSFSISLNKEDAEDLDIDVNNLENGGTIRIPYNKYCGLLYKKTKGKELIRTKDLHDLIPRNKDKDEEGDNNIASYPDSTAGLFDFDLAGDIDGKFLQNHLKSQIKNIYSEKKLSFNNSITEQNDVSINIIGKNSKSAADQTAIHDFDNLQIAFENVWAEAFDTEFSGHLRELYNSVVDVMVEYNDLFLLERKDKLIGRLKSIMENEKLDFKLIISELSDVSNIIGEGIPIPIDLWALGLSEKLMDNWKRLSIGQQNKVITELESIKKPKELKLDDFHKLNSHEKEEVVLSMLNYGNYYIDKIAKSIISRTWSNNEGKSLYQIWKDNDGTMSEWRTDFKNQILNNLKFFYFDELYFEAPKDKFDWNKNGLIPHNEKMYFDIAPYIKEIYGRTESNERQIIENILNNPNGILSRTDELIRQLNERLLEPYSFHVFAPDSVNFGIITTYRQEWKPENWQVGDLVSTIPLTPGEKRKYNKKLKVKKTRAEKEIDKSLYNRSDEASYVSKAHSDIIDKTKSATNFNTSVKGSIKFGVGDIENTTGFKEDQSAESARTKKAIRESTTKAKNEYKNERSIEISTSDTFELEELSSGEISNPNNEITVTYLFYELERQYRINEYLHKLTPVILVAFEVPAPHEVDEDWLLTHEWILRRILLDDSFNEALDYLRSGMVGDQINFEAAKGHYHSQKIIVEQITGNVKSLSLLASKLQEQLNQATDNQNIVAWNERRRDAAKGESIAASIFNPALLFATLPQYSAGAQETIGQYDSEYYESERKAFESRINLTNEELRRAMAELGSEENVLEKAKNQMMQLTDQVFTKRNLINQLRIHVKQNILYYMQGIWAHEPPDQRYFRLYNKIARVPIPKGEIEIKKPGSSFKPFGFDFNMITPAVLGIPVVPIFPRPSGPNPFSIEYKKLHEVADLDRLIGFKGNYAIFPLKECTYITDFMMRDYVNDVLGLGDPDALNIFKLSELKNAYHSLENEPDKQELREQIAELITAKLTQAVRNDEIVVVPTGQLYIEALPGKHVLLEDFKLKHRALDVEKVREEVREAQLENLRRSARLLKVDPDFSDPDVDKKIQIEGADTIHINE